LLRLLQLAIEQSSIVVQPPFDLLQRGVALLHGQTQLLVLALRFAMELRRVRQVRRELPRGTACRGLPERAALAIGCADASALQPQVFVPPGCLRLLEISLQSVARTKLALCCRSLALHGTRQARLFRVVLSLPQRLERFEGGRTLHTSRLTENGGLDDFPAAQWSASTRGDPVRENRVHGLD
jgi:hypothetical protein